MAYRVEYALLEGQDFYAEFRFVSARNKQPLRVGDTTHSFNLGHRYGPFLDGVAVATNANGLIKVFEPGVITISIPAARFCACPLWMPEQRSVPFQLIATNPDRAISSIVAYGTLSFGGR